MDKNPQEVTPAAPASPAPDQPSPDAAAPAPTTPTQPSSEPIFHSSNIGRNTKARSDTDYFVQVKDSSESRHRRQKAKLRANLRKNRPVFIVVASVILVIIVTGIIVFFILQAQADQQPAAQMPVELMSDDEISLEDYSSQAAEFAYSGDYDDTQYSEVVENLKTISDSSNQDVATSARLSLAQTYLSAGDNEQAIRLLTESLADPDLLPRNRICLLSALVDAYEASCDSAAAKATLEELVAIPEDTKVEGEDWHYLHSYYQQRLEEYNETTE